MCLIRNTRLIFSRNIIGGQPPKPKKDPKPVKLAVNIYEDTKTRDIQETNTSPPLLVLHGLFGCKGNWESICKAMQQRTKPWRKIIAADARNHGDSAHSSEHSYEALASDARALLKAERVPQVALLGHSMGGRAAMYIALKFPELVERLIVVDIAPTADNQHISAIRSYLAAMLAIQLPSISGLGAARSFVDTALKTAVPQEIVRAFLIMNVVQNSKGQIAWRLNLKALSDNYLNIATFPIEPDSGKQYLGPTTFIAGGLSEYIKKEDHSVIKKFFPNSKLHTVAGAGHWVHSEKTKEFLEIVMEALNQPKN